MAWVARLDFKSSDQIYLFHTRNDIIHPVNNSWLSVTIKDLKQKGGKSKNVGINKFGNYAARSTHTFQNYLPCRIRYIAGIRQDRIERVEETKFFTQQNVSDATKWVMKQYNLRCQRLKHQMCISFAYKSICNIQL